MFTTATESVGLPGVVVAVLGSSALGAILGGYITTALRGRIERAEAWRTRLIDATEELQSSFAVTFLTLDRWFLDSVARGEKPLFDQSGTLTDEAAEIIKKAREKAQVAHALLPRIQLLYGEGPEAKSWGRLPESPYLLALTAIECVEESIRLVAKKSYTCPLSIRASLAERKGEDPSQALGGSAQGQSYRQYVAMSSRANLPDNIDVSSERSLASWAVVLRTSAAETYGQFVDACVQVIHRDNPAKLDR